MIKGHVYILEMSIYNTWINNSPWPQETQGLESIITKLCCYCCSAHSDKDATLLDLQIRFSLSLYIFKGSLNLSPWVCIILSPAAKFFNISISRTATICCVIICSVNHPTLSGSQVPNEKFLTWSERIKERRTQTDREGGCDQKTILSFLEKSLIKQ